MMQKEVWERSTFRNERNGDGNTEGVKEEVKKIQIWYRSPLVNSEAVHMLGLG
jgi:hypothetical protein